MIVLQYSLQHRRHVINTDAHSLPTAILAYDDRNGGKELDNLESLVVK